MKFIRNLAFAATAFALSANPVLAAEGQSNPTRAATPVGQSEQLFGEEGNDWLLWALLGIAVAVGLVLVLDEPASP